MRSSRIDQSFGRRNRLFLVLLSIFLTFNLTVVAQKGVNAIDAGAEKMTLTAVGLMRKGEWKSAHEMFQKIVAEWGNDSYYQKMPAFGTVYYNRGYCEMKLKEYGDAVASFKICHEDFDNTLEAGEAVTTSNVYQKTAVFQWAAAEQLQENYEEAIKRYLQFKSLDPEPVKDHFNPAVLSVNLGVCYAKINDRENAEKYVSEAFALASRYRLRVSALWPGFLAVLESYVSDEEAINVKGATKFIDKFGPTVLSEPLIHGYYGSRLLKLAQDSVSADRLGLAWRLFALVPKTDDVLLAGKIAEKSGLSKAEKQIVESFKTKQESGEPLEISTYFGLSNLYAAVGDTRAQFAIFDYMGTHFLKTSFRPSALYLATKTASEINEMADAQRHGLNFLAEFPEHELVPNVTAMLLSSMFFNGEYERCIEIAGDLRPKLTLGSPERDLPDFVYSGSLYYLGRYQEAQPELDSHVKNYKESPYKENSTYYQASNLIKLYEWQRAASLLD